MGVASYRRGNAVISRQFACDAYRNGWTNINPDAAPYTPKPRPATWGDKARARAEDHTARMIAGAQKYGIELDPEALAYGVSERARCSMDTARAAVDSALSGQAK